MDDGLAPTPPMGWNSWNCFRCAIDERLVAEMADALVASSMRDAGYSYLTLDDGWMAPRRESGGILHPDPDRFPSGMAALADHIHSLGLKLGIYQDAGAKTCAGYPGSFGHYQQDAETFASWGVDLLKFDWCYTSRRHAPRLLYAEMRDALRGTGRPIVFSICCWGIDQPWLWGPETGHMWRTTGDIRPSWDTIVNVLQQHAGLDRYAGPGHWNDPDMLEIGNGTLSEEECRAHFSLWSILAAPLIAGNDLREMPSAVSDVLLNREVIAVDQDALAEPGRRTRWTCDEEVWVRRLANGDRAVVLLNRSPVSTTMGVTSGELKLAGSGPHRVRDLWHGDEAIMDEILATVPPHGVRMFRIAPAQTDVTCGGGAIFVAPSYFPVGRPREITVAVTSPSLLPPGDPDIALTAPPGWAVTAQSEPIRLDEHTVQMGATLVPPANVQPGPHELSVTASGIGAPASPGWSRTETMVISVPPGEPDTTIYLSDRPWLQAGNGAWSGSYPPVQRDRSADGNPISVGGVRYDKGLGVHAFSEVRYYLGGAGGTFEADIGIDDEVDGEPFFGSERHAARTATFQVWGDGKQIYGSGVVTAGEVKEVQVDITGVEVLTLIVGDAGDGTYHDHADWANARITFQREEGNA